MFPSQMVRLKIVEPSSCPLCLCFMVRLKIVEPSSGKPVSLANGTPQSCRTLKWPTLSMFPFQMVRVKLLNLQVNHLFPSSGLKLVFGNFTMFPSQMVRLKILEPSSFKLLPMFPSQMVRLKIVEPSSGPLCFHVSHRTWLCLKIVEPSSGPFCPCFPRKWYALKLSNPQVAHFVHVSLANFTT